MRALRHAAVVCRPGAALDAFLLKIVVEERLGYPAQLLSDGQLADVGPDLRISEGTSLNITDRIYSALARGEVDMHPEVTPADAMPYGHGSLCNTNPSRRSIRFTGVAVRRCRGVRRVRPS